MLVRGTSIALEDHCRTFFYKKNTKMASVVFYKLNFEEQDACFASSLKRTFLFFIRLFKQDYQNHHMSMIYNILQNIGILYHIFNKKSSLL